MRLSEHLQPLFVKYALDEELFLKFIVFWVIFFIRLKDVGLVAANVHHTNQRTLKKLSDIYFITLY